VLLSLLALSDVFCITLHAAATAGRVARSTRTQHRTDLGREFGATDGVADAATRVSTSSTS
jgi:hypothetical protein